MSTRPSSCTVVEESIGNRNVGLAGCDFESEQAVFESEPNFNK